MCMELMKLVDRIEKVFPEVEAARPRCSSGIQSLCLLNGTIEKARQILWHCCESSKLYLVITGDVIVSRCQRSRKYFEQSLGQIQAMVPTMLSAEISQIIDDLNAATFTLDSCDEVAGRAVRELIQQGTSASDSVDGSEIKALRIAASRLHITSPKAILIEKRSIKKLLDKVGDNDPTKRKILRYLLYLLKKYGNLIMEEQIENPKPQHEGSVALMDSTSTSVNNPSVAIEFELGLKQSGVATDILTGCTPPEEFKCPISMRVMYDPVVIASGETFERMWIRKWFNDGNITCPKTKVKLPHHLLTPNTAMKDLISKWCERYRITISDPSIQEYHTLDISSTSIASLGNSMNDIHLPLDISNMSLGSLDASYSSDSRNKVADGSSLMLIRETDDCHRFQSNACVHETDSGNLTRLSELQWDSQSKMVEYVKKYLQYNDQAYHSLSFENFVGPLIRYLRDAHDQHDVKAQKAGSELLLAFVSKNRSGMAYLHEEAFSLLVSFLDSEVVEEALAILEVLSSHPYCRSKITESGALVPILKILEQIKDFQEKAIKILHNLSSNSDVCSQIVYLECIPKLVPFINDGSTAKYSIVLLRNLCDIEEARISVAETNGCIASISELLESGSREEQEHAVVILLSLCSQRVQYCKLVMDEGVIPSLVDISINGNEKGKAIALELLRQLRDIEVGEKQEPAVPDLGGSRGANQQCKEKKSSHKTSGGIFKFSLFSKFKR
ncbi:U-box domain-containing protein 5 isoform X2 [Ricinus communis]|nr:U-box domain-containing protein 5 isoform X2 [Ricinus communis]|eukprot:XP_025013547.1 U-box domain-containing protein 5 isoform X2 [Ricinus communis]